MGQGQKEKQPDSASFSRAVAAIYAAASEPAGWPDALQAIAEVFGDVGALITYQREAGGFGAITSASLGPLLADFVQNFRGDDLRAQRGLERGLFLGRDAITDRDVVTLEEMDSHPFYKLLSRHGLRFFAAMPISPDPRVPMAISVQRSLERPPYNSEELELITLIGKHAEQSMRLSVRLLDSELSNHGLREALDGVGIGVFVLDTFGRILLSNPVAEQFATDAVRICDGRLTLTSPTASRSFEKSVARVLSGQPENFPDDIKPIVIEREGGTQALALHILPLGTGAPEHAFLSHGRVIVLIVNLDHRTSLDPALVRDLLGLTLGEARLATLIGSGLRPREAAEKLGIAEHTARTVLKRVFSKTGVSRQSELAALLARLALR